MDNGEPADEDAEPDKPRGRPRKKSFPKRKVLNTRIKDKLKEYAEKDTGVATTDFPSTNLTGNKKQKKTITSQELQDLFPIYVLSIDTDIDEETSCDGEWHYYNAQKCIVKFTCIGSEDTCSVNLRNLLNRGIPSHAKSSTTFRWYSWIRFKQIASVENIPLSSALSNEKHFLYLLKETSNYYTKCAYYQKQEGLDQNQGPQSFQDASNIQRLHYYGHGTVKYYRKTTFIQLVGEKYGENVKAEFLVHPTTPMISSIDYEELLRDVHKQLSVKYRRHLNKLQKYAGPQCEEDRMHKSKVNYDVKFTSTSSKSKTDAKLQADTCAPTKPEEQKITDLTEFYLRKCGICTKIRWVGKRAARKFVLGSYTYSGTSRLVNFRCDLLHDTSCDDESDILPVYADKDLPALWIAYHNSNEMRLPPVAIVFKRLCQVSECIYDAEIMAKYTYTNSELHGYNYKAVCVKINSPKMELGQLLTTGRFQRFSEIPVMSLAKLNRRTPREALVCQSWLDSCANSHDDPTAVYTVSNLTGIRDLHAVYGAMRMIHCSQCGMCSPGFDADVTECISVPENGKSVPLSNELLTKVLKQSKVLCNTGVTLSPKFESARVYSNGSVTGICTECATFSEIDEHGEITLKHQTTSNSQEEYSQGTNSQEPIEDNISNINPYSVENLMALDVFHNEASHQYAMFMDTLSQAERLVISPIHAVIVILRSRTNNIPFSRHGSISFQMKQPAKTKSLPWHTFERLPFVVMVSSKEDGSVEEAKINMAKIVHAKELMEREVVCPVYGTQRPFYRYCDQIHTPFTVTAMETLSSQLYDLNTAVPPSGLRKISTSLIHERATKSLNYYLFSEWLNSGFVIGNGLKDAFVVHQKDLSSVNHKELTTQLWNHLNEFVKANTKVNPDDSSDSIQITASDVIRCAIERGWLNSNNDVAIASQQTLEDMPMDDQDSNKLIYLCCEELELLLRESSNDEGDGSSVAQGGVINAKSESPEEILTKGMRNTVLERIPAPQIDREHPVPENTPGYLQMAFPDVFLTGDGCPHQQRPRNIKNVSENYLFHYYRWVIQQPRAMVNIELQFLINSMIKRQHSKGKAKLAIRKNTSEQREMPVKEDLIQNAELREWTASNLMMFKSAIPDSTSFWKRSRDDSIAVQCDWEEVVPWRPDKSPMSIMLFQTRAPPYNHHPGIHQVCPGAEQLSLLSNEEYLEARRRNVLQYPSIITFMCALMAELDTKYLSKLRYDGDCFFTRFEWGANANPHSHRLLFSQKFSNEMNSLKHRINSYVETLKTESIQSNQNLADPLVQEAIQAKALDCWDGSRSDYIDRMRPFYTNWNAGLLSDGNTNTFDYIYERKSTICRVDMASTIDLALSSGSFLDLDTIYVSVVNGTCRHLGHSGINDQPAKSDKCAVIKRKRIKSKVPGKKEYKEVITCKRRKPHMVSNKASIEPDPHNKKLYQLQFESNDKWFNGHDPFEILHILSNADDKAIVPDFLRKPPTLDFFSKLDDDNKMQWDLSINHFSEIGDTATEYVTKYAFKDVINTKTSSEVLVTAMENLQDGEQINQGTVQKMYNTHAIAGTTSIFQATHLNLKIPLAISNVTIKHCSMSGLSLLRNDYNPADGEDYTIPPLIKMFDGRHDDTIVCKEQGKLSKKLKAKIQSNMCLHQFCDLYDVKEIKDDAGKRTLFFKRRFVGRFNALKLIPCHGLKVVNPNNKFHWNYCRTLCLWKIPCHVTTDLTPTGEDDETIKKGWIELFNKTFVDGNGLPPWAYKYWKHYNLPRDNDSDVSSEDDEPSQQDTRLDTNIATNDINNSAEENVCSKQPSTRPGKEQFYQNPVDRWRACPQNAAQEQMLEENVDHLANPEGVDFMRIWLGDRTLPSMSEINSQLANLINSEGILTDNSFDISTLNEKQHMAHTIVVTYFKRRMEWEGTGRVGPPPTPLRLFLMGNPGTGKSWTLKCLMNSLITLIGSESKEQEMDKPAWQTRIKLAAPTGAASSQMHFKAETLHRLFCIPIHLTDQNLRLDENSAAYARLVLNFDPEKFILLIVDEFSMVSRQMFAFMTERLEQCNIDLNRIGIVLIGDPAQILPIGADPLWSSRLHNDNGKDCSALSILGMSRFRKIFNFPPLQTIEGFDQWQGLKGPKARITSDAITTFRKKSMKGDFDAVFLTEIKRTETDEISKEFTSKILVNLRYGAKCRDKEINFLRKHCAKKTEVEENEMWRTAHVIHGYHFHSSEHTNRGSVEADNAIALLKHHKATGNPIMRIDSIHRPVKKQERLKNISAKEFEGAPATWHACKGMRVMLLRNIAPSVGLYNGSIHTLIGPIYNNDSIEVSLTLDHLKSAGLNNCITTMPIDTCGKEKQVPPKSTLVSVDGMPYDQSKFDQLPAKQQMQCKFMYPQTPPTLPDFMVLDATKYSGPNILKLTGCDNYVPIAPVESHRSKSKSPQTRIALPLEGGDAATGFKGQGATYPLAEVDLDGWYHVPGFFLVAISRVKSPIHLHVRAFPTYMDIRLQRLKENVLDAQAFEEAVRVKSEWLYRHRDNCEDRFWNYEANKIADTIIKVAVTEGLSMKRDEENLLAKLKPLLNDQTTNTILEVKQKLVETREYLLAESAPHISTVDFDTLMNYQKKKSVTKVLPEDKNTVQQVNKSKIHKRLPNEVPTCIQQEPIITHSRNTLALKDRPDINRETFKGLQNIGNNLCFMNAAIIALCHTVSFDQLLRQCHDMHRDCTGHMFGNDAVCPLCALYEIVNRAYRHHSLQVQDVPKMPIIKLTESLLPGWRIGMEHDADEFLTRILDRLDVTIGCEIHKGIIKTDKECQLCKNVTTKQQPQRTSIRLLIRLSEFSDDEINIQDGVNRWIISEQHRACSNCGHDQQTVRRAVIESPNIMIINILRFGNKTTRIDHDVVIGEYTYVFKSSINFHPHHYTTVGSVNNNQYTFYSDEEVQTCHGSLTGRGRHHSTMNRVRVPLEELSTLLLYERLS